MLIACLCVVVSLEGYDDLIDWPQANLNLKNSSIIHPRNNPEDCDEEAEGVQSKERWAYVKVNMDGIIIGRKVCILDHSGYSSLAFQLEDMFGRCTNNLKRVRILHSETNKWFICFR